MKKIFKNSLFTFILGAVVFGCLTVYGASAFFASQLMYTPQSGTEPITVQAALDQLNSIANSGIKPATFGMVQNSSKTVMASNDLIIAYKNGNLIMVRHNNYDKEKLFLNEEFSNIGSCEEIKHGGTAPNYYRCTSTDFACTIYADGYSVCADSLDNTRCYINTDNSVACT